MKNRKAESGMIVVEAVFSFTIFIFAVMSIILLINIYIIHNRVQFALNTAANQVASISYVYELSSVRGRVKGVIADGSEYMEKLDKVTDSVQKAVNVFSSISGFFDEDVSVESINNVTGSINSFTGSVDDALEAASDPMDLVRGGIYKLFEKGAAFVGDEVAEQLITFSTKLHLDKDWVKAYEEKNETKFDFSSTQFLDSDETKIIDAVVEYDYVIPYLKLFGVEKTHIVNRACVGAWLDGDGSGEKLEKYKVE